LSRMMRTKQEIPERESERLIRPPVRT
jgi:hypothetical protein